MVWPQVLGFFLKGSLEALTVRLNELANFQKTRKIRTVKKIRYRHLIGYAADYNEPSIYVKKSRAWPLRQFYHFLTLHRIVSENIATGISYPKIEKQYHNFSNRRNIIFQFTFSLPGQTH